MTRKVKTGNPVTDRTARAAATARAAVEADYRAGVITASEREERRHTINAAAAPAAAEITNDQLQAAFLAARQFGKILEDDVLAAIITAARNAA
jgi:hypothetical protein